MRIFRADLSTSPSAMAANSTLVCVADFEERAKSIIEKTAFDYYRSGAGEEFSLNLNKDAFRRLRLRPRVLKDVSKVDTKCNVLGVNAKWPIGISPTAMQKLAHPEGEVANARAAGNAGCVFIMSTLSTCSIEEVAKGAPHTDKWFQLYIYKDRVLTENLVRRAEKAGFKAIVLTVDAPKFGDRRADKRNKFELHPQLSLANFTGILADGVRSTAALSGINAYVASQFDPALTWKDVQWLVNFTTLPVVVKGILRVEDAILAAQYGCKGIIVSNHGARQIDGVPASIEALPEIAEAVGNELVVMMDGGITQGTDAFKALALGAKMVFMGRPALWGLAVNGQEGVEDILKILLKDFVLTMELMGCSKLSEISKSMVVHENYYTKL